MKRWMTYCILALYVLPAVTSCSKSGMHRYGESFTFVSETSALTSDTKAAYTGEFSAADPRSEKIIWQMGDKFHISCPQASAPSSKVATYYAYDITDGMTARIHLDSPTALAWGNNETHYFYSMYPAPEQAGAQAGIGVSGTTMTAVIPDTQTPGEISSVTGGYTAVAPPALLYMTAKSSLSYQTSSSEVFLTFKPIITTIEFEIKNDYDDCSAMNLISAQLTSSTSDLSGTFTADINTSSDFPECIMDSTKVHTDTLTVPLGTDVTPLAVAYGETVRITFICLPIDDLDGLSLILRTNSATDAVRTLRLKKSDDTYYSFPVHMKSYVRGILAEKTAKVEVFTGSMYFDIGAGTLEME